VYIRTVFGNVKDRDKTGTHSYRWDNIKKDITEIREWTRLIRNRTDIFVCCNPKLGHTVRDEIILNRVLHKYECRLDLYETGQTQTFLCVVIQNWEIQVQMG